MKLNLIIILLIYALLMSCDFNAKNSQTTSSPETAITSKFQISLAQWSLHRSFFGPQQADFWQTLDNTLKESPEAILKGKLDPLDFPAVAAGYGIYSIELVNLFYYGKVDDTTYWHAFKQNCKAADVTVGLIMCDALGNLADSIAINRQKAVENHYKWVDIAKFLGAHSVRVNAAGNGSKEKVAENAIDGLSKLGKYAAMKGINILVENHGGYSSDASWLVKVMQEIDLKNVGTLPDFGNFCIENSAEGCINEYDKYRGMAQLMPYAKGVSAKSYGFDEQGNEIKTDFLRMMKIVGQSGYKGTIGIEYEGDQLSEVEGIKATMLLLKKVNDKL